MKARKAAKYWEIMAVTDDLTGLHNRRMINKLDEKISERRRKDCDDAVTLLFIDLDDFGQINKIFGDDVGDDALRLFGHTIRKNIRTEDIAIRKGGDEFVVILIGTTPEYANQSVVERLRLLLDGELSLNVKGTHIPIMGSIGVFPYNQGISPFENLKIVDELMREQKQARKKRFMPPMSLLDAFKSHSAIGAYMSH